MPTEAQVALPLPSGCQSHDYCTNNSEFEKVGNRIRTSTQILGLYFSNIIENIYYLESN
jgi:hypothetical protein